MDDHALRGLHGHATIDPSGEVVAGGYGTWRITYTVGHKGIASGGAVRIHTDSDTDWGLPQFDDPSAADYATVQAPPGARLVALAPNVRTVIVVNQGRPLRAGERLTLTYGDASGGGPGSRAQTFQEARRYFGVAVDAEGTGRFVALPDPPYVSVVGGQAARLVAVVPSLAAVGEPFHLLLRAVDAWENPSKGYRGTVSVESPGVALPVEHHAFAAADGGVHVLEGCACRVAGVHRIVVRDAESGLSTESNPLLSVEEAGENAVYWGEPHGGQLVMAEKIPDFFRYARDVAGADFVGYQRNDHEVTNQAWALQQQAERDFHQPGRFVPLPGFEWSGETAAGGDHNVFFRRPDQPIRRSGHESVEDKSDVATDLPHIRDVYQTYRYADVVIVPHVGGRTANLDFHEPNLEPVIEVTSTHGTFEWFLEEALRRGYRVGFVGGSDGYTGRPGAEYPGHQERRYAKGGLTALYASSLTVDGILEALQARRCYATTGARILVQVEADGHPMGAQYRTSAHPSISVRVAGTAPLEGVELFRGLERAYSHPLEARPSPNRVRVLWEGASRKTSYSGVVWDGSLRVNGARIAAVEQVRFDSPRSQVLDVTTEGLRWHSVACGYASGIVVEVDGGPQAELEVALRTTLITGTLLGGHGDDPPRRISYAPLDNALMSVGLADLASGPRVVELGPLNRRLTLSLAPEPGGPREVAFTFTDPAPRPGINPYWVRVVQTDMDMAWTSPIFVDYVG